MDSRSAIVAVERTSLRRSPGPQQEGHDREVRRRGGEEMAPFVRHTPCGARSVWRTGTLGIRPEQCGARTRRPALLVVLDVRHRELSRLEVRRADRLTR